MTSGLIATIIACAVVFLAVTIIWGIKAHRRRVAAGREELVGMTADAKTAIEPKGTVFIQGENWTAISKSSRIEAGEEVIVTRVDGLKLWVTRKESRR